MNDDDMLVNRCDCTGLSFAQLLAFGDLQAAMAETEAGRECSGCLPYLKLAFATGETAFAIDDPRLPEYE
jgi:hypothetical protein